MHCPLKEEVHTFAMSQAITFGSLETRSREKTLFFTLFAMSASPVKQWGNKQSSSEEMHDMHGIKKQP